MFWTVLIGVGLVLEWLALLVGCAVCRRARSAAAPDCDETQKREQDTMDANRIRLQQLTGDRDRHWKAMRVLLLCLYEYNRLHRTRLLTNRTVLGRRAPRWRCARNSCKRVSCVLTAHGRPSLVSAGRATREAASRPCCCGDKSCNLGSTLHSFQFLRAPFGAGKKKR